MSAVETAIVRIDSKLDSLVDSVADLSKGQQRLTVEIAELKGRVSQLPTTIQMLGFVIAVLLAGGFMRHFFP